MGEEDSDEMVFEIANHLNLGSSLITEKAELIKLAKLNLKSGNIAKNSNSYEAAVEYLRLSMAQIDFDQAPDLYKEILVSRSEAEYLAGNHEISEEMYDIALRNVTTDLEKAQVYADRMALYENTNRQHEAIVSAVQGLKSLGMNLPEKPGTATVLSNLVKTKLALRNKSIEDLKALKKLESPVTGLTMKILMQLWGPAYLHNPNLLVLAILKLVQISVKEGNAPESALAYAFYGYVSCAQLKDFKGGHEFAKLGLWLNSQFDDKKYRSKVYVIYAGCVAHWREPYHDTIDWLAKAYRVGIESNDLVYAGYAVNFLSKNYFLAGEHLESLIEKYEDYLSFSREIQSITTLYHLLAETRMLFQFIGKDLESEALGEHSDLVTHRKLLQELADREGILLPIVSTRLYEAKYNYFFNNYEKAIEDLDLAEKDMIAVLGLQETFLHKFITSASLLALARNDPSGWKSKAIKKAKANRKMLKKWAENANENFQAKYLLVEAELAAVLGKTDRANALYTEALEAAESSGIPQVIALINERMSIHFRSRGVNAVATALLEEAVTTYRQWGAQAKVNQLTDQLLDSKRYLGGGEPVTADRLRIGSTTSSTLDLQSIFKASTTISGEVIFDDLQEKLLKIVMENAGAQIGAVIMVRENRLLTTAKSTLENNETQILEDIPVEQMSELPNAIIQYCFHTKEPLILDDPVSDPRFSKDPFLIQFAPKSILCQPILRSGKCLAIIYLEHRKAQGVFTTDRLEVLRLLSGQIAVSLQNAELYKSQQDLSEAYFRFVPQEFIRTLGYESILPVRLGDCIEAEMTVMFCDIRSYTSLAEGMTAQDNFKLINKYLQLIGPIINRNGGFINHYLGDGFIALFRDKPDNAIKASIEMHAEMFRYNQERQEAHKQPIMISIGLHTGDVMMGVIGDADRHDANVLSDAVNVAARLEGLTRIFDNQIILSASTLEAVEDRGFFIYRDLGSYRVKGKDEALRLYEIIDADKESDKKLKKDTYNYYNLGLQAFERHELDIAKDYFKLVVESNPQDALVKRFLHRIEKFENEPLPANWSPTEDLMTKG